VIAASTVLAIGCAVVAAGGAALGRQWRAGRRELPRPEPIPPGSRLTVVVPVRDEAATIGQIVARVPRTELSARGLETSVLVVDDGSRDGSGAVAAAAGAERVLVHPTGRGLGAALRAGLSAARCDGASVAVYLDGDGEYDPAEVAAVAEPILAGRADYVLGSRFPDAGRVMAASRRRGNRAFTGLLCLLAGRRIADGQTGFRAFGPRALASFEIVHDYNYAQVLTLDLLRKGMRLAEVPIRYRPRSTGRSFIRYPEYARRVLPAIARELLAP
jgi:glycosyltransferase involved in cell wall biosynthesis